MKVIYVAGKYRADTENGVFENIIKARTAALKLWRKGYAVICPHLNSMFMGEGEDVDTRYLDGDLEILRHCDAIFLLPGWQYSKGAKAERELALKLGLEILE